jgi:hypothetical protein
VTDAIVPPTHRLTRFLSVRPSDMMNILHTRITQLKVNNPLTTTPSSVTELCEQERSSYAMIVSLFAASHCVLKFLTLLLVHRALFRLQSLFTKSPKHYRRLDRTALLRFCI